MRSLPLRPGDSLTIPWMALSVGFKSFGFPPTCYPSYAVSGSFRGGTGSRRTLQPLLDARHVDTSVVRLLDGTRAYLHAVIDNFSRRILAWRVSDRFEVGNTVSILAEDGGQTTPASEPPTLLADGGVENWNSGVDELIESGIFRRLLAMTEITFSNSLIESWWRVLQHQWLFPNSLDSVATVRRLVSFYVSEHNSQLPHSAFRGQTPDEMYFGTGSQVPKALEEARAAARRTRLMLNRTASCSVCRA